jgi:hypothetical protein
MLFGSFVSQRAESSGALLLHHLKSLAELRRPEVQYRELYFHFKPDYL